jgi:hypothetical protein
LFYTSVGIVVHECRDSASDELPDDGHSALPVPAIQHVSVANRRVVEHPDGSAGYTERVVHWHYCAETLDGRAMHNTHFARPPVYGTCT